MIVRNNQLLDKKNLQYLKLNLKGKPRSQFNHVRRECCNRLVAARRPVPEQTFNCHKIIENDFRNTIAQHNYFKIVKYLQNITVSSVRTLKGLEHDIESSYLICTFVQKIDKRLCGE